MASDQSPIARAATVLKEHRHAYDVDGGTDDGTTKGGLIALQMQPANMPAPVEPALNQRSLWEAS